MTADPLRRSMTFVYSPNKLHGYLSPIKMRSCKIVPRFLQLLSVQSYQTWLSLHVILGIIIPLLRHHYHIWSRERAKYDTAIDCSVPV